jgi:hypothetical protein
VPSEVANRKAPAKPEDLLTMCEFISTTKQISHGGDLKDLTSPRLVLLLSHRSGQRLMDTAKTETGTETDAHPLLPLALYAAKVDKTTEVYMLEKGLKHGRSSKIAI